VPGEPFTGNMYDTIAALVALWPSLVTCAQLGHSSLDIPGGFGLLLGLRRRRSVVVRIHLGHETHRSFACRRHIR